jgi:pre-mRNA-processing factor 19
MFFCAISGEVPTDPVVASPSGNVYERRLIEKYIAENNTDPITGGKLELSDLITVKASEYYFFHVYICDETLLQKLFN